VNSSASDSVPSICGILDFLNDMRAKVTSKIIFQDNLSTIQMIKNARPTSQRTKHINTRYFSVRERIERHNIEINHLPTASMTADILTKLSKAPSSVLSANESSTCEREHQPSFPERNRP
jgi:hypothetical protein